MAKNFKSGIVAGVIAVTIATAGITTVSSFTLVSEAQAWSIKSAVKKAAKGAVRKGKSVRSFSRAINRKVVPSEIRNGPSWIKKKALGKPVTAPKRRASNVHDHRTKTN